MANIEEWTVDQGIFGPRSMKEIVLEGRGFLYTDRIHAAINRKDEFSLMAYGSKGGGKFIWFMSREEMIGVKELIDRTLEDTSEVVIK